MISRSQLARACNDSFVHFSLQQAVSEYHSSMEGGASTEDAVQATRAAATRVIHSYALYMREPTTSGGELELNALSKANSIDVTIYRLAKPSVDSPSEDARLVTAERYQFAQAERSIFLLYSNEHYDAIVPTSEREMRLLLG